LKTISWVSGVELNYTKKRLRFFITFTNVFLFLSRFTFFNVFKNFVRIFFTSDKKTAANRYTVRVLVSGANARINENHIKCRSRILCASLRCDSENTRNALTAQRSGAQLVCERPIRLIILFSECCRRCRFHRCECVIICFLE